MPDNAHDSKYFVSITGEMWIFTVCLSCVCVWGGGGENERAWLYSARSTSIHRIHALSKCKEEDIVSTLSFHYTTYMHYIKPNKNNII